jgi:lipopolysaccharide/colanic/teichoic acid biosynthesis glycosyltransferase
MSFTAEFEVPKPSRRDSFAMRFTNAGRWGNARSWVAWNVRHAAVDAAAAVSATSPSRGDRRSELVNRIVNVVLASLALIVVSPFLVIVALLVKLTSEGPIFYTQTRVGFDRRRLTATASADRRQNDIGGRVFRIIKFRSMSVNAEQGTGAIWAAKNDPRVTPIGAFLRKTRLDELPQLVNVIRGDMNIVGPRPERPGIFAELRQSIDVYPLRQRARPGITGWAQINRAYDASIEDVRAKVALDLEYLERQSLVEDLKIMAKTVPVMLFQRGAN